MYLRLAFAVAAHLEPEILVVDEVLAVGDAEFQRKCLGKMSDVAQAGPDGPVRQPQHVGHPAADRRGTGARAGAIAMRGTDAGGGRLLHDLRDVAVGETALGARGAPRATATARFGRWRCGCWTRGRTYQPGEWPRLEPFTVEFEYELEHEMTGSAGGSVSVHQPRRAGVHQLRHR